MHLIVLGEYPYPLVKKAFMKWIRTESRNPTPADIVNLIHEENEELLDLIARYRQMQYCGGGLTQEKINYIAQKLGTDWKKYV